MSTKMTNLLIKMENKHIKCHIFKWANVVKLFWNKYAQKKAFLNEERTKCSWYFIENYFKNQKQSFLRLSCSVSTRIYRGKYTYFLKRVITSLKLFLDYINLKNESASPKLVINGLLVDITNVFIFLQVEIQVHMKKNTIFY